MKTQSNRDRLTLYYDGDCPFCDSYVHLVRLREEYDVDLVNARDDLGLYQRLLDEGLDLDAGMVLDIDGQRYHGAACINRVALLTTPSNGFNRLNKWLFSSPARSRWLYPVLVAGRNGVIKAKGIRPLAWSTRSDDA